nr:MAG TPA: hypothetical protein [Caudoviricetes sp.]
MLKLAFSAGGVEQRARRGVSDFPLCHIQNTGYQLVICHSVLTMPFLKHFRCA